METASSSVNPATAVAPGPLVCFAVKEEAAPFRRLVTGRRSVRVLITGMGRRNAERALAEELTKGSASFVLSAGFAGGLNPELETGAVVFTADPDSKLEPSLLAARARPGKFYCAERIVVTASEKRALREKSGADAVEMESEIIRAACRARSIPSATVRVVLDTAGQDLPLDFNLLLDEALEVSPVKLAAALARAPAKISLLLGFQKQVRLAGERLAAVLFQVLERNPL